MMEASSALCAREGRLQHAVRWLEFANNLSVKQQHDCFILKTNRTPSIYPSSDLCVLAKSHRWKNTLCSCFSSMAWKRAFLTAGFMATWKVSNEDFKHSQQSPVWAANGDFHISRSKEHAVTLISARPADAFVLTTEFWVLNTHVEHSYWIYKLVTVMTMWHTSPHCKVAPIFSGHDRKY